MRAHGEGFLNSPPQRAPSLINRDELQHQLNLFRVLSSVMVKPSNLQSSALSPAWLDLWYVKSLGFILHDSSRHRLLPSWPLLYHQYWNSGTSSGTSIRMGKYIWTWYSLRISLPIKTAGHTSFCFTKKTALMLLFDVRQSRVNKSGKAIKQYYLQVGPGNNW